MSRYHSYLNTAITILDRYKGEIPFASALKQFFAADKKYGSKDRKIISHFCYCFFRTGHITKGIEMEERILTGLSLCDKNSNEIIKELQPNFKPAVFKASDLFPFNEELSEGIDLEKFSFSFLVQPDLFLRMRPGFEKQVKEKIKSSDAEARFLSGNAIALPNGTKVDSLFELDKEVVVQDLSSQKVLTVLEGIQLPTAYSQLQTAWDCCAGSGGKSIMAYDKFPGIELTVSDNRESILANLKKRFKEAGIHHYKSFQIDLSTQNSKPKTQNFDLVLADVPCTGSGTWSRNPEQLYYFDPGTIEMYAERQRKIVSNVVEAIKPGGHLLYITCSVFRRENEDIVNTAINDHRLECIKMSTITGYEEKADTMFAALLRKSS